MLSIGLLTVFISKNCLLTVFYRFYIGFLYFFIIFYRFYKFSTEDLRLGTGAIRRLSLAKKDVLVLIYRKNREGTVHCFYSFSAKLCLPPPSEVNSRYMFLKIVVGHVKP